MNIKTKLTLSIGTLVAMIILLVSLSVVYLQILTATEPNSPNAGIGLDRALLWVLVIGGICICIGLFLLFKVPNSINAPVKQLINAIQQIANKNYDVKLDLQGSHELHEASVNFNIMAKRLSEYYHSTLTDLMASKRYLETVINSMKEPIIGLDNNMKILFINDEALKTLNLNGNALIGQSAEDLAISNDLLRKLVRGIVEENSNAQSTKKSPLSIYTNDKESYFKVEYLHIELPQDKDKNLRMGYVILLQNVTEYQELNAAKTTFISTISHELKTPISAIMMSLQLLEDERIGKLSGEQKELAGSIKDNSERLLKITGELLNITKVESGKLQLKPKITKPIELIDYAIKANRVQAEKFGIQIEVEYPDEGKIGKLFVDSEKIAWVLTNLVSNAIHYSYENGRVIIGARLTNNRHIELYVRDFGKGIDKRYHESIFDHYFRVPGTKVQGSGLGLAISRDFVEAHGGTIHVESEIGKGSCFIISLAMA